MSKNLNLLNETSDSRFANIANDQSNANYDVRNYEIIYNTNVVKSNLSDYNNPYILVRKDITVAVAQAEWITQVALKIFHHLLSVS